MTRRMADVVALSVALLLLGVGLSRFVSADLDFGTMDKDQVREYLFHFMAGLFLGWGMAKGFIERVHKSSQSSAPSTAIVALLAPLVVLVLAHQTRDTINDGPITCAIGLGFLITYLLPMARDRRKKRTGTI